MAPVNDVTPSPDPAATLKALPPEVTPLERVTMILKRRGLLVKDMAEALNRSRIHLWAVITGERQSPPLKTAIAEYLGVEESDIWI